MCREVLRPAGDVLPLRGRQRLDAHGAHRLEARQLVRLARAAAAVRGEPHAENNARAVAARHAAQHRSSARLAAVKDGVQVQMQRVCKAYKGYVKDEAAHRHPHALVPKLLTLALIVALALGPALAPAANPAVASPFLGLPLGLQSRPDLHLDARPHLQRCRDAEVQRCGGGAAGGAAWGVHVGPHLRLRRLGPALEGR
eukprot:scaffold94974_cov60-Phaeocystis_antarctica.AAC.12